MTIAGDLRYAIRVLRRTPSFTLPAGASLALGIAINTTMFSVVNALLLRPFGTSGGELVRIGRSQGDDRSFRSASYEEFEYLRRHASSFADVMGHQLESVTLGAADGAEVVSAEVVTGNYFSVLGVQVTLGRGFAPDDDRVPGERAVVVISDRLWRHRFSALPDAVGGVVSLNNHPFTIVGVAGPRFRGIFPGVDIDLWIPSMMASAIAHRADRQLPPPLMLIARLKPDVPMRTADVEVGVLARRMTAENPARDRNRGFVLASARGLHPGFARVVGPFLTLLMAVVVVVLLIACANVASLLLARASRRRGELAVRLAVGAGRGRLIRQLLVESSIVALLGGATGLLLSVWTVRLLNAFPLASGPTGSPIVFDLQLDGRVLLFTAAVTMLTTLFFGLMPAIHATRVDLVAALKDSASSPGRRRSRLRGTLVVVQIAGSFVLLVAAVLLSRSVRNTARLDVGFDPDHVVVTSFDLQMLGYERYRMESFYTELLRRARALPGVERAALSEFVPMGGRGTSVALTIPGATLPEDRPSIPYNGVSDGYFGAIGHVLLRGREFTARDRLGAPVAIINDAMARRFWPGEDPLGKRVRVGEDKQEREIIGIAGDARYGSFGTDIGPFILLPLHQYPPMLTLYVRSAGRPADTLADIRRVARELDTNAAPQNARPMREAMALALVPVRVARLVFGAAGVTALLLASGGLYGLVCYTLEQRLKEIGIRVALGASRRNVFATIVGGAVRLSVAGVLIGLALAAAGMPLLASILYGLSPTDPPTFVGIAALLILVTLAAGYAAARKGLTVDPMVVLRRE